LAPSVPELLRLICPPVNVAGVAGAPRWSTWPWAPLIESLALLVKSYRLTGIGELAAVRWVPPKPAAWPL
jgi:hypothetical protein